MNQSESNNETLLVTPSPTSPQETDVFPEGLRVLAVDDNSVCLALLERLLCKCKYEVETASDASKTLKLLKEKSFDIVIIDVHMPNKSDGFKLLEIIGLQMDIPVVMMSADDDKNIVLKAIEHGACDYLVKPVRMQEVKNIWQHVIRKNKIKFNSGKKLSNAKETKNVGKKAIKREREEEDDDDDDDSNETIVPKKPRFSWTQERHSRFIAIVSELGVDNAAPSKIMEKMGIPGLTRQQVASHLQKFRSGIKKTRGHETYESVISTVMNEQLAFNSQERIHFGHQVDRLNNLVHAFPQRLQAYQFNQMNQAPMFGHVPQHSYIDLHTRRSLHPYPIFGSSSSSSSRPFGATEFVDQSCREFMSMSPDHTLQPFDHMFEGPSEGENIENLDMQILDENFMPDDHNLMDEHPIDDLETEYLMQNNSSSSPEEDLVAIIKHHLQSPP